MARYDVLLTLERRSRRRSYSFGAPPSSVQWRRNALRGQWEYALTTWWRMTLVSTVLDIVNGASNLGAGYGRVLVSERNSFRSSISHREADLPLVRTRRRGDGRVERVPAADEHHLFHPSSQGGVDQSTIQQASLHNGHDHPFELAALRFVNGDRVSQLDALEVCLRDFVLRAIERTQKSAPSVRAQNALDSAQRTVPQLLPVVIHEINDGIALGEAPPFQLWFRGGSCRVQRRIDVSRPAGPSLGHAEDLRITTSAPLGEDTEDMIGGVAIARFNKAHAGGETGEGRQGRHNAVSDPACDLRDAARSRLPVNLNQLDPRDIRAGGEHLKDETEADRWQLVGIANQK